ncbi:acyltransferase family protein [Agromyces larvae]|uniref:Acyltransferase n=1 Tax=Agromyces larvae TaxID=2929802 RepID=A0ABY4BU60_9MICO|nr:acyltransferase [Agromyces larvae]UOE42756.1 acyltransferase [Agromyces larvae]
MSVGGPAESGTPAEPRANSRVLNRIRIFGSGASRVLSLANPEDAGTDAVRGARESVRVPGLDGLRGIAVLCHYDIGKVRAGGAIGVTVFFVLSGYLITTLLVSEFRATGRIDFKAFYMRRIIRLLPAFLLLVAVTLVILTVFQDPTRVSYWGHALASIAYIADYVSATGSSMSVVGHTWSLAVEEQFYLLWPLVLLGVLTLALQRRREPLVAIALILGAAVVWRVAASVVLSPDWVYHAFDTNAYALLTGCLIAVLLIHRPNLVGWRTATFAGRRVSATIAWSSLALLVGCSFWILPFYPGNWICVLAILLTGALLIAGVERLPILSWRPLRWFGTISYGLYLWHAPLLFVRPHDDWIGNPSASATCFSRSASRCSRTISSGSR